MKPKQGVILIIDDDFALREMLKLFLEMEKFEVRSAEDGAEGLRSLREQPVPQLVLLDLMMPVMDGFQFLEALKTQPDSIRKIPVIILTAASSLLHDPRLHSAAAVVGKPFDVEKLSTLISEQMKVKPPLAV